MGRSSISMIIIVLLAVSFLQPTSGYTTEVIDCGSIGSPKFTELSECTVCAFTLVDVNMFNTLKNAKGCLAGLSGMYAGSTAAKGYHCLTVKEAADGTATCSVHKACGSKNATDVKTKSCIYTFGGFSGIDDKAKCPADETCGASASASSKMTASIITMASIILFAVIKNAQ